MERRLAPHRTLLVALIACAALLLSAGGAAAALKFTAASGDVEPTRYIIAFDDAAGMDAASGLIPGGRVVARDHALGWIVIETVRPQATLATFSAAGGVRFIEEDASDVMEALFSPNDPRYGEQTSLPAIRAAEAWDATRGSTSVKIAILDSGVDVAHSDLGRLVNARDMTGGNSVADVCGHGTHVTGIAGATIHNGLGIAGVSQSLIVPVKVLKNSCAGSFSHIASGIVYAADQGSDIISMSLGCRGCYSSAVADAVNYAANTRGALVVVAAGNSGCEGCVNFPATLPDVIAVGCTTTSGAVCSFSSRGSEVDIAAPGESVLSTESGNRYGKRSGTSMSAPHVAGVAALVLAKNPGWSAGQLRGHLLSTAKDVGANGWDSGTGAGVVDAAAALGVSGGGGTPPAPTPVPPPSSPTRIFAEDFDDGRADGWRLTGLWRVSGDCLGASDAPNSLQYARAGACNYDTGARTSGLAEFSVDLDGTSQPKLSFATRYQVENYAWVSYDRMSVSVSTNGGSSWTTLFSRDSTNAAATGWTRVEVDLAGHRSSSTLVRFEFDSVDEIANAHPGWAIDDLWID